MAYHLFKKQNTPVRGVLFDMDGVIIDTEKLYTRFWQEAGIALGYPMTKEHAMGLRSLNRAFGEAKLKSYFGEGIDYEAVRNKRIELMDAFIGDNGVDPKPGVYALLDALHEKGIPCAIASSSPHSRIEQYLKPLGLYSRFDAIVSGYDVAKGKPEPDIYLTAASKIGIDPKFCYAVEDSPAGILSAYKAGCMPIMVPDQDLPDEKTQERLFALCDSLTDVIPLLWSKNHKRI